MPAPADLAACFSQLNQHWFDANFAQIDAAISEVDLQRVVDRVYAAVALLQSTIQSQINYMFNFEILLTAPTDLATVIQWVTSAIAVFQQMYLTYAKMLAQVAAIESEMADLTAEIERVANLKNWHITIPPIDVFCQI